MYTKLIVWIVFVTISHPVGYIFLLLRVNALVLAALGGKISRIKFLEKRKFFCV